MVDRRRMMFDQLARQAAGANVLPPGMSSGAEDRLMIPTPMRKSYPRRVGPSGQSEVIERPTQPPMMGVSEKERGFIDGMHKIQNAHFTGADFGYEEDWDRNLGVTQEMIDMFMSVPEEAFKYAMENPTDAVLEQFEEFYGFPLNVNDRDMAKYFAGG